MKRQDCLNAVGAAVLKDRQAVHGSPENSFETMSKLWTTYLASRGLLAGRKLEPHDVPAMMILFKVGRIASNPLHEDNWTDAAGYAACGVEVATHGYENVKSPAKETGVVAGGDSYPTAEQIHQRLAQAQKAAGGVMNQAAEAKVPMVRDRAFRPDPIGHGIFAGKEVQIYPKLEDRSKVDLFSAPNGEWVGTLNVKFITAVAPTPQNASPIS